MSRKKRVEMVKTSMYLPKPYIDALNLIKEEEMVLNSRQVQMALRSYFEKYKSFLLSKKVDLWSQR